MSVSTTSYQMTAETEASRVTWVKEQEVSILEVNAIRFQQIA